MIHLGHLPRITPRITPHLRHSDRKAYIDLSHIDLHELHENLHSSFQIDSFILFII